MKRIALFAVLALLLVAGAAFVYAEESHGSTKLTIEPSQMKDGETKTLVDGDKTITVKKSVAMCLPMQTADVRGDESYKRSRNVTSAARIATDA